MINIESEAYVHDGGGKFSILLSLQLYQCPNEGIVQQSIGALLNLSVGKRMRAQLGRRGAVAVLLRELA